MPDSKRTKDDPASRAVAYAEGDLDVHGVYDRAAEAIATLEDNLTVLRTTAAKRRTVESEMLDCEIDLTARERAEYPEWSQAQMDRHMKVLLHEHDDMVKLRSTLSAVRAEHERAEHEAELSRIRARVEAARLEELGGLLHFYAARTPLAQRD